MQREEIIEKINEFLIDEFEIEADLLVPEANLKESLNIDSLDFVDLIVIIEKNFGFKVKAEDMSEIKTLSDFYEYIITQVNLKN